MGFPSPLIFEVRTWWWPMYLKSIGKLSLCYLWHSNWTVIHCLRPCWSKIGLDTFTRGSQERQAIKPGTETVKQNETKQNEMKPEVTPPRWHSYSALQGCALKLWCYFTGSCFASTVIRHTTITWTSPVTEKAKCTKPWMKTFTATKANVSQSQRSGYEITIVQPIVWPQLLLEFQPTQQG